MKETERESLGRLAVDFKTNRWVENSMDGKGSKYKPVLEITGRCQEKNNRRKNKQAELMKELKQVLVRVWDEHKSWMRFNHSCRAGTDSHSNEVFDQQVKNSTVTVYFRDGQLW